MIRFLVQLGTIWEPITWAYVGDLFMILVPLESRSYLDFFLIYTVTTPTLASTGMTPILDQPLRARSRRRRSRARESGSSQGYTQPTTHEAPRPPIRGRLGQPIPSPFRKSLMLRGQTHLPALWAGGGPSALGPCLPLWVGGDLGQLPVN